MKQKTKKPIVFRQDFSSLFGDVMTVSAGATAKDIIAYAKKRKYRKEIIEFIQNNDEIFGLEKKKWEGAFTYDKEVHVFFLVMGNYEDTWEFWETLVHELYHAVRGFSEVKSMQDNEEALARLQGYLFRSIRRKLQGVEKK